MYESIFSTEMLNKLRNCTSCGVFFGGFLNEDEYSSMMDLNLFKSSSARSSLSTLAIVMEIFASCI